MRLIRRPIMEFIIEGLLWCALAVVVAILYALASDVDMTDVDRE